MDHDPVRDIVLAGALPAAFESACLLRCADVRPAARQRTAPLIGDTVAEFDHGDAATRLTLLLTGLGCAADRESRTGGGRRRYDLHRVLVPGAQRMAVARMTAAAWRQGRQALLSAEALGASSRRHAQRVTLAHAAWRAALLAGGRRRRGDLLWVRTGDQEMAAMLVRAARLIGEDTEVSRRPGCFMVAVPLRGALSAA
ncbi:hypothetical protein ACQP2F_30865 [Actinoplanes sp. CA-030573]|uniref:hypothetical protein n=1 Tax=Actinoplanes sp. CA-030573 TaxID=3239898 RepID=UPI003D8C760C